MKIVSVTSHTIYYVSIDCGSHEHLIEYERHGKDTWYVHMGESSEPIFNCKELEEEFQKLSERVFNK